VTTGVVVCRVFLTSDDLFWVEKLTVRTCAYFVCYGWFQINEYTSWNVFASTSFTEEGVESVVTTTNGLVTWHLAIRLDAVL
jgi:hypothetical protein